MFCIRNAMVDRKTIAHLSSLIHTNLFLKPIAFHAFGILFMVAHAGLTRNSMLDRPLMRLVRISIVAI